MVDREQPTQEIDPREVTLAYLQRRREEWLPHYHRAQRAGGNSAEANLEAEEAFKPIDRLLDELNALGSTAVRAAQS